MIRWPALLLPLAVACGSSHKQDEVPVTPAAVAQPMVDAGTPDAGEDPAQTARDQAQIAAVQKAVNDTTAVRHTCWELGATDDFDLTGSVVLKLKFGRDGQVVSTATVLDNTGDAVLVSCLRDLYGKYRWPPVFREGDAIQLPFSFQAPRGQYTVRYDHVVAAAAKGAKVGGALSPKLSAHVLLDHKSTGNGAAAVSILRITGGLEIPMHRHTSAELLYVSSGGGTVFGLGGKRRGTKVSAGTAIYIPAGTAHGFAHTGSEPAVFAQLYAPGGPEQRFKTGDKRGTTPVTAAEQKRPPRRFPTPIVVKGRSVKWLPIAGGKGRVRILLDEKRVGDKAAYLGVIEMQGGVNIPAHKHPTATELLLMTKGSGTLVVEGKRYPVSRGTAIQIPTNIEHAFEATSDVQAIQFYSPSGPEQRFRGATK